MTFDDLLVVCQARHDGKTLQWKSLGDQRQWRDGDPPLLDFVSYHVRVKPEPLEVYGNVYPGGLGGMYLNPDDADSYAEAGRIRRAHFREVDPE